MPCTRRQLAAGARDQHHSVHRAEQHALHPREGAGAVLGPLRRCFGRHLAESEVLCCEDDDVVVVPYKGVAAVVIDVYLFDHAISNMDAPEKVVSQVTTVVQSVLGRKMFGGLFSLIQSHQRSEVATKYVQKLKGASLSMASLNTILAATTSAIVSALDLPSLPARRVCTAQCRGCGLKLEARTVHSELEHRIFVEIKAWGVRHEVMEPLGRTL